MTDPLEISCALRIDGEPYHVLALTAREPLDDLGELRALVTDHQRGPAPRDLVGKPVVVTLQHGGDAGERTIAGHVVEAERTTQRGDDAGDLGTQVVVRPRLFRLTQRTDCRTFQQMSVPEIVKKVLAGAGLADADQAWKLEGAYAPRTYVAQYRESDWAFVRRLLSEEGIAFAIDGSSGKDRVVFFDTDLGDVDDEKEIPFGTGDGLRAHRDAIGGLVQEQSTTTGKVHLRDYDFTRPSLKLDAKAEAGEAAEKALEIYAYPGRFTDPAVGDRFAKVLLDSVRARREVVRGHTTALRLHAGRKFQLAEHPYEPLNREYLLLRVEASYEARRHEQDERRGVRMTFEAIPTTSTTYRPPRVPRAVSAPGAQVATTTGAPGKEIHPDEHGRVKVLFPWDRLGKADDSSSLWIRTCQLPLGGSMLTPRVGWEVSLDFTDGDPDQPLVFGRMVNTVTPPPYPLPKNKTRMSIQTATTPGGGSTNEIRMDDKAGAEEMFMNASKDASVSAGNNATDSVGNNETKSIGANQSLAVTDSMSASIGASQSVTVGGSQSIHVATKMVDDVGSHSLSIGGGRDVKAGGDHKRTVSGASTLNVGGSQIDLVAGSVDEQGMATMDDKIGAALVELTPASRSVVVRGSRTETAGAVKIILASGGRAVKVGADLKQKVAGAILTKIGRDRMDAAKGDLLEIAGGAQLIKADNVVFEAKSLLSVVMGASTITLTPASVSIAGVKITFDGECDEVAPLIVDN
jgi:type VI secretion system secreted protein VgrG